MAARLALLALVLTTSVAGLRLQSAGAVKSDHKLQLTNFQNVQYFGDFTAGGQRLPVIYDTGSFEVIVLSTRCKKCEKGPIMYDQGKSPTFDEGDKTVAQHVFGSGPVLSVKGKETCLAGTTSSPLVATQMPFWQVLDHDIDVWDKYSKFSGIVGLGHSAHTPDMGGQKKGQKPDVVLLERMGVNSFSFCLQRASGTPPGWLTMGPQTENSQSSSIHKHVPVVGNIHWGVQMTQLAAGGKESTGQACNPSCAAIIDSGTSLIAAPSVALQDLMPVFDMVKKDCSNLGDLPDITFNLGNERFELPPAIYILQLSFYQPKPQTIWDALFNPPELELVTECVPSFMQMDMRTANYGPVWILGMPFLRYYHTTFQRNPKSMHMAYADANCDPTASPPSIFASTTSNQSSSTGNFAGKAAGSRAEAVSRATHIELPKDAQGDHPAAKLRAGVRLPDWAKPGGDLDF